VPADIQDLKETSPEVARAWRSATRRALLHYLGRGLRVTRFLPDGCYLLEAR
jgi:predicted GNAT superfamily acetyltransferase